MNTPGSRNAESHAVGSAVLVAMLVARPMLVGSPALAADCGDATCCSTDASCDDVMVWLGPGPYPAPLPDCVRVTRDRGVWDDAVADLKRRHPDVGR